MGSYTNNSVIVLIVTVTMLLASVNAREAASEIPPQLPPMAPPTRPPTPPPTSPPPSHIPLPTSPPRPPPPPSPPRTNTNTSLGKPQPKIGGLWWSPKIVMGDVYCNCPRRGSPLRGARVQLSCRRNRFLKMKKTMTTSSTGRFYGTLPLWAKPSKCKVKLLYAPSYSHCRFKTNLNGGIYGARLRREHWNNIYAVGPFSFTTSPRMKCYK